MIRAPEEVSQLHLKLPALFSQTFAEDTFGVALSLSYQERDGGEQSASTQDFMGP